MKINSIVKKHKNPEYFNSDIKLKYGATNQNCQT